MPRYRATVGGQPIGPWRAHREVALLDAVEASEASLDPTTGKIHVGMHTRIEKGDGDELATSAEDVTAAAIDAIHQNGSRAPVYAEEQARGFDGRAGGSAERWQRIKREVERLLRMAEARRTAEFRAAADDVDPRRWDY